MKKHLTAIVREKDGTFGVYQFNASVPPSANIGVAVNSLLWNLKDKDVVLVLEGHAPVDWLDTEALENQPVNYNRGLARMIVDTSFPDWTSEQKGAAMRRIVPVLARQRKTLLSDIREFHEKFGLEYDGVPRMLPEDMAKFRIKFMQEELDEYSKACEEEDLVGAFDALIDLAYVLFGTVYLQGLPFAEGWTEVHGRNMAKVRVERAEDSKRGSVFDVVKPEGWTDPNHEPILAAQRQKYEE